MDEVFLFYWLGWLLVIIVYFFIEEHKYLFLYTLFLMMICIDLNITLFGQMTINAAFIVLFISSFIYYARLHVTYQDLIVALIIIFCYIALSLWEKLTPIWFIVHPLLMIPIIIVWLVIMISKGVSTQLARIAISLSIGQFLFGFILISYGLHEQLVERSFFIMFFIHVLVLLIFRIIKLFFRLIKINVTY